MRRTLFVTIVFGAFSTFSASAFASELFVQSRQAPLWSAPSFQSAQLAILSQGTRLENLGQTGGWYHVRHNHHEGWMLTLMLSDQLPLRDSAVDQQVVDTMAQRARRRPSAFASTAAARGLTAQRRRFSQKLQLDFEALEKMESWRVNDQQALEFLEAGRSHEANP